LRIGAWCVDPASRRISREGKTVRLEARTMRLLLCLAEHAGRVVSVDELLEQVWAGVIVTPDSVYQAVAALRRLLGDDPKQPTYIATEPRLGYRMVAPVSPWIDQPAAESDQLSTAALRRPGRWITVGAALLVLLGVAFFAYRSLQNNVHSLSDPPQKSVAVMPFLDLTTQEMDQEYLADGMTEELIDKLSKMPGFRVPAPTSSFFYKNKKATIPDIAKALGVAYVVDGSLRKSGSTIRVAARLIRADSGYVVWSETYDRRVDDILKLQDDIAGEVMKALRTSIEEGPKRDKRS
jgi:TolB-like protein/DNA-binding winged helix-turn-helix (wHTH) protein